MSYQDTENPSPTGLNLVNHLKENNNNVIFSNKQSVLEDIKEETEKKAENELPTKRHVSNIITKMKKKISKFQMLKLFIVKSLQQEEDWKKEQDSFKVEIKRIIKQCERDIIGRLVQQQVIPQTELEYDNENIESNKRRK